MFPANFKPDPGNILPGRLPGPGSKCTGIWLNSDALKSLMYAMDLSEKK